MQKIIIIFVLCMFMPLNIYGMQLVKEGKPKAKIIIAEDCPDSVRLAASEFQKYVQKTTGALLPIDYKIVTKDNGMNYVLIGESEYTKQNNFNLEIKKTDAFRIVNRDNLLVIIGKDYKGKPITGMRGPWLKPHVYNDKVKIGAFGETGTLYGVYYFLNRFCGVRWYMPGELGEVIRPTTSLAVSNIDIQKAPDFEYRYVWLCNFDIDEDAALWYKRVGFGGALPVQINHSFYLFLPYKDTHPEYFALINGQRDFTNLSSSGRGGGNLCLSNEGVLKQWVADIRKYFDDHPEQQFYPVVPNDALIKICECKDCQSKIQLAMGADGKFSDYIWSFVDRVAQEVYKSHPDKFIGSIAYGNYTVPPSKLKSLNPNVAVMICKSRMFYNDPEYKKKLDRLIELWGQKTKNIYIWEYYLNTWGVLRGLPVFYPHIISKDLQFLKKYSKGEFIEAESWQGKEKAKMLFPGLTHLNLYVTGKLYWETEENIDAVLDEYYKLFYGDAAEEMQSFWRLTENIWMKKLDIVVKARALTHVLNSKVLKDNLYDKDSLSRMNELLQKALKKVPRGSIHYKRIDLIYHEAIRNMQ